MRTESDRAVPPIIDGPLPESSNGSQPRMAARVFEATSDAIFVTDPEGVILDVNPAFETITGYSREEVVGSTPRMMKSGVHDAAFFDRMWQVLKTVGRWRGEIWDRRKNGEIFPKASTISAIRDDQGRITHFVTVFNDISEAKRNEQVLRRQAHFDPLTDLPNRNLFMDRLEQTIEHGRRAGRMSALMFLDLDRFKDVNDSLGHRAGDLLLIEAGRRLRECVRTDDTVARLGGDEFTVLLYEIRSFSDAARVATKILETLARPFLLGLNETVISASIGITVSPVDGDDPETLLRNADAAMYHAKRQGRAAFRFFAATMNEDALERIQLENCLRDAVRQDALDLHFQPVVDLTNDQIVGAEALFHWLHPFSGLVPPQRFLPIAEDSGQIVPMGRWALKTACLRAAQWNAPADRPLFVSVGLSTRQFLDPGLPAVVREALEASGLPPTQLELTVNEATLEEASDRTVQVARGLADTGARLVMSGVGSGGHSVGLACHLPLAGLRLDRNIVAALPHRPNKVRMIAAILAMAGSLGLEVAATGVETPAALEHLRNQGVRHAQGSILGVPTTFDEFTRRLSQP